ncbi:hypothetical protein VNO77_05275 [Canavalia gladiata]|uniref:Uncharacterized protein n=1 Tax=Canavalia gladiata TaxID=3824 RepID=A0AAN9MY19_CANGL
MEYRSLVLILVSLFLYSIHSIMPSRNFMVTLLALAVAVLLMPSNQSHAFKNLTGMMNANQKNEPVSRHHYSIRNAYASAGRLNCSEDTIFPCSQTTMFSSEHSVEKLYGLAALVYGFGNLQHVEGCRDSKRLDMLVLLQHLQSQFVVSL